MGVVRAVPDVIARARVEAPLRDALLHAAITIVQAPLGAGKSTAIAAALAGRPGVAWLDARPWHRDEGVAAIVHAARSVREDFGRMTLGAAATGAPPDRIARVFSEELAHVDEPLLLVIDNAHEFHDDVTFGAFMQALVDTLPEHAHVMLAGRRFPRLMLGEGVVRRRTAIIDADLFTFAPHEITELAARLGRTLEDDALRETLAATQGWATGVMLALASTTAMLPADGEPRSAAAAFLAEQLLPTLQPAVIAFLERVSVLETIDLRVTAYAALFSEAPAHLAALRENGALVADLGNHRFALHPVLRELAATGLRAHGDPAETHHAAAAAYAAAGEISAAIFHTSRGGRPAAAAAFLREHAAAAIATGEHGQLRTVVALIDADGADADVRAYVEGLLDKGRGLLTARDHFARAAAAADRSGDRRIAFSARAEMVQHDLGHLAHVDRSALDELHTVAAELGVAQRAAAAMLHGWAFAVAHDFDAARATIEPLTGMGDAVTRFNVGILHAYALTACGEIDAAEDGLDTLVRLLESGDSVVLQALTLVWFARLALTWGHTTVASDAATQAHRLASVLDLRAEEAALYGALAELASHSGNADLTLQYAENARARANAAWYVADIARVRAFADIALARVSFLRGEYALARDVALRATAAPGTPGPQAAIAASEAAVYAALSGTPAADDIIERARAAISAARPIDAADAAAISTAAGIIAFLETSDGKSGAYDLPACAAFARLLEGRNGVASLGLAGAAVANLRAGSGSAEALESIFAVVQRNGPRFDVLLARAYASHFVTRHAPTQSALPQLDLTAREFDILTLLVDGLTNKEIAQRLVLSPRTVETHVERVLGKLEVGSRSRAIAKALRLGIVALEIAGG